MILKHKRTLCDTAVFGDSAGSNARKNEVVMYNDSVLKKRNASVLSYLAVLIKAGSSEDNVVGLPLLGGKACIAKRSLNAVDTGAIVVVRIFDAVGIENLDLVAAVNISGILNST